MKNILKSILLISIFFVGCKEDFLEVKPNKNLLIPKKLSELQAILDNVPIMNNYPTISTLAADEFLLIDNSLTQLNAVTATGYLWLKDNYQGTIVSDWNQMYRQVFYANVVLDALKTNNETASDDYNRLKGSALFYRAHGMFNLAMLFTKPYSLQNLNEKGLPYPLISDINNRPSRGTINELYQQIIKDLNTAENLSATQVTIKNRPTKQACHALLARVYLSMGEYKNALDYAKKTLENNNKLVDFNKAENSFTPFPSVLPNGNDEVIYFERKLAYTVFNLAISLIDPTLDATFEKNDLRRKVLFYDGGKNTIYFAGFEGLTTGEAYLIAAECSAREGDLLNAANYLNILSKTRYKTNTYTPIKFSSEHDAISKIIIERRKELFSRGLRWGDLRRLNLDPKYATTIKRKYNGTEYTLAPNSEGYVFQIPNSEIQTSGIEQN